MDLDSINAENARQVLGLNSLVGVESVERMDMGERRREKSGRLQKKTVRTQGTLEVEVEVEVPDLNLIELRTRHKQSGRCDEQGNGKSGCKVPQGALRQGMNKC